MDDQKYFNTFKESIFRILTEQFLRRILRTFTTELSGSVSHGVSKPTGKIPLGMPRRRWKDNNRIDLEEIGINTRIWVYSAQDREYWRALVSDALNLRVPQAMELQLYAQGLTWNWNMMSQFA